MKAKKGFSLFDILISAVCLASAFAGALFYSELPADLPVHFDSQFQADSYMSKNIFLFVIPVILTVLEIGVIVTLKVKDPLGEGIVWFKLLMPAVDYFMYFIVLGNALGVLDNPGFIVCALCSFFMLLAGAVIPAFRKTPRFILRIFPTLKRDTVLYKTRITAGAVWVCASGILMAISFLSSLAAPFAILMLCLIIPPVYSVAAYHSEYESGAKS